jgi:hypothetical protein
VTGAVSASRPAATPTSLDESLIWADFQALCALGGRLAGSASEAAALAFARRRLAAVPDAKLREDPVQYPGWRVGPRNSWRDDRSAPLPCR